MKLSSKGRYAVMAMADLAAQRRDAPVPLADIARRQGISQAYLEQLFAKLRRHGLVNGVRGPNGGYVLAASAGQIRIADILLSAEEPVTITRCRDSDTLGCTGHGTRCLTHDLWEALGRQIQDYLNAVSLEDVITRQVLAPTTPPPVALPPSSAPIESPTP